MLPIRKKAVTVVGKNDKMETEMETGKFLKTEMKLKNLYW